MLRALLPLMLRALLPLMLRALLPLMLRALLPLIDWTVVLDVSAAQTAHPKARVGANVHMSLELNLIQSAPNPKLLKLILSVIVACRERPATLRYKSVFKRQFLIEEVVHAYACY